jgi:hypothetical protein
MNSFPELESFPEYEKLRKSQPEVHDQNFIPQVSSNILTKEQIEEIYSMMDSYPKEKIRIQKWGGQGCYDTVSLSDDIKEKILSEANKMSKEKLEIEYVSIVRYSPEFGYDVKLFPHYDTRPCEMFVFDLQLKSNEEWGIIVEGKKYNLEDNQAILFSGTQQMHWREKKKLSPNAQIDMIFVWLSHKEKKVLSSDHSLIMKTREEVLLNETKISNLEIPYGITIREGLMKNSVCKDIFTDKETEEIYSLINYNQSENTTIVPLYAQKVWLFTQFPESIIQKVKSVAEKEYGEELTLEGMSFARYSIEYGERPNLTPHYDNTFIEQRLTLDIQLRSSIRWPIVVEDSRFILNNNEGLTFSGTHQIHWREYVEFEKQDFVEMLFCHFSLKNKKPISLQEKIQIESKMAQYSNGYAVKLMDTISQYKNIVSWLKKMTDRLSESDSY